MMKAAAPALTQTASLEKGWMTVFAELFKARLNSLVLLTTCVGFWLGSTEAVNYGLLFQTVLGTALLAAGASSFNQLWERRHDARMRRTQDRPLPSGRLEPRTVAIIGVTCASVGLVYLTLFVNPLTAALGAASLGIYLLLYTPLKRVTWANTLVGTIPGGLPSLMGWTAAQNHIGAPGLAVFAILGLWQLPHFMAIAWIYRDDYANAGFKMLPVLDPQGRRTGRYAIFFSLLLLPVSLVPFWLKVSGPIYFSSALLLGGLFAILAWQFSRDLSLARARRLFVMSLAYLPLLLIIMVADKIS